MTQLKFNLIKLFFSVLFLMPSFLQARSIPPFPTVIFPPPIHYHPPPPIHYPPPRPFNNTCYASSFCQTYSGNICPLVNYAPQSFSTCLTEGYFFFCLEVPLLAQTQTCQPFLRGSPCVCTYNSMDYFGNIYNVYENGFTL